MSQTIVGGISMVLKIVTITGADNTTKLSDMLDVWREFPFVEFGILFGSVRTRMHGGTSRFPTIDWIERLMEMRQLHTDNKMRLSLHLCDVPLKHIAAGHHELLLDLIPSLSQFGRCQLNWHGEKQNISGENILKSFVKMHEVSTWYPEVIFQLDGENDSLLEHTLSRFVCTGLFDRSHGAGVLPGEWPKAMPNIGCGWAGGLGPDNLADELPKISACASPGRLWWVDMETHVRFARDSDGLDFDKVRTCLKICRDFMLSEGKQ